MLTTIEQLDTDGRAELVARMEYEAEPRGQKLVGDSIRFERDNHSDYCEGCLACWSPEIAEREAWERGI